MANPTPRQRLVLAALAAEPASSFAPVQVQKLFFLLDQNIAADLGGRLLAGLGFRIAPEGVICVPPRAGSYPGHGANPEA